MSVWFPTNSEQPVCGANQIWPFVHRRICLLAPLSCSVVRNRQLFSFAQREAILHYQNRKSTVFCSKRHCGKRTFHWKHRKILDCGLSWWIFGFLSELAQKLLHLHLEAQAGKKVSWTQECNYQFLGITLQYSSYLLRKLQITDLLCCCIWPRACRQAISSGY